MRQSLLSLLLLSLVAARAQSGPAEHPPAENSRLPGPPPAGWIVLPGPTNALRFRLYTNASPDAPRLFNTFDIEGYGQAWLQGPSGDFWKRALAASPSNAPLHNLLVDGTGPDLDPTNSMTVVEQASGAGWSYVALDVGAAYRGRLKEFKRGILFVEPDLFVLHDHLVAEKPARLNMVLHPPSATLLDPIWQDLKLISSHGGMRIHAPGRKHDPRGWKRIESSLDLTLPGTATLQLGPTNSLTALDVVTVFAVYPAGQNRDYAFKLLESNNAIGARIHRDGLPTLVAFRTDPGADNPSLIGFAFRGPVGVDVFKLKKKGRE